jgi:hypothetical protein
MQTSRICCDPISVARNSHTGRAVDVETRTVPVTDPLGKIPLQTPLEPVMELELEPEEGHRVQISMETQAEPWCEDAAATNDEQPPRTPASTVMHFIVPATERSGGVGDRKEREYQIPEKD